MEQRDSIKRNLNISNEEKKPASKLALHSHQVADAEQKQAVFRTRGLQIQLGNKNYAITLNTT